MKRVIWLFMAVIVAMPAAFAEDAPDSEYVGTDALTEPLEAPAEAEVRKDTRVRVFPLVKHDRNGDQERTKVLYVPGASVVKSRSDAEESKVEVLDIPFFTLAESEHRENGDFDNKAFDLPILGPLFRHRREDGKEKMRFLIFSHTRRVNPDEAREPTEQRERRRSGGGKSGSIQRSR